EIQRFLKTAAGRVEALARVLCFHSANGSELLGIVSISVGAVLRVIDFAHQAGVSDGNVVALEIVVDVNLPVAVDHIVAALDGLQAFELEAAGLFGNLAEGDEKRLGVWIEVDEDELLPSFQPQRHHAHGAAVEELDAFDVGRADEAAIERVSPAVVAAAENIFAAAALRDRAGAVAADVAEGAQRALLVAHNDDGFTDNVGCEEGLGIRDRAFC